MRRVVAIFAGAALVGAFAASAAGRTSTTIALPLHGTAILSGSNIRCGSGLLKGLIYIDCGVADARGEPKKGSYVVLMASDGRVNVINATTLKTVFSRAPAAVVKAPPGIAVHPGDTIVLPKTSISCEASKVSGKPTILCYYVDKNGVVRPQSLSFGISDGVVTALGWDDKGHVHLIKGWPENG